MKGTGILMGITGILMVITGILMAGTGILTAGTGTVTIFVVGWGRVYYILGFPHRWLVKPAPTMPCRGGFYR
jgi:hypothetical protein